MDLSYSSSFATVVSHLNQLMTESVEKFDKFAVQQACFVSRATFFCNVNGHDLDVQGLEYYFLTNYTLVDALAQMPNAEED